jgi:hypothetical protein
MGGLPAVAPGRDRPAAGGTMARTIGAAYNGMPALWGA